MEKLQLVAEMIKRTVLTCTAWVKGNIRCSGRMASLWMLLPRHVGYELAATLVANKNQVT